MSSTTRRSSFLMFVFVSFMVLSELMATATAAHTDRFETGQKVRVEVTNLLSSTATIHCKSKDDDLGPHVIGPGMKYSFGFTVNFFGTTLFFCTASTSDGRHASFNVFKASRDEHRCSNLCSWHLNADGVEGFGGSPSKPDIVVPWQ